MRHYGRRVVVLRPWLWQRLVGVVSLLFVALLIAGGGGAAGGWLEPAGGVAAGLMIPVIWRVDRQRVELRDDAVVVVNFWRTHVIPWAEVEKFAYGAGAVVLLTGGRMHRISVFAPQGLDLPFVHRQCQQAVQTMEDFRARVGAGSGDLQHSGLPRP